MLTHPANNKHKNRKKNYDWYKSTDNRDACGVAEADDGPDGESNRRCW